MCIRQSCQNVLEYPRATVSRIRDTPTSSDMNLHGVSRLTVPVDVSPIAAAMIAALEGIPPLSCFASIQGPLEFGPAQVFRLLRRMRMPGHGAGRICF